MAGVIVDNFPGLPKEECVVCQEAVRPILYRTACCLEEICENCFHDIRNIVQINTPPGEVPRFMECPNHNQPISAMFDQNDNLDQDTSNIIDTRVRPDIDQFLADNPEELDPRVLTPEQENTIASIFSEVNSRFVEVENEYNQAKQYYAQLKQSIEPQLRAQVQGLGWSEQAIQGRIQSLLSAVSNYESSDMDRLVDLYKFLKLKRERMMDINVRVNTAKQYNMGKSNLDRVEYIPNMAKVYQWYKDITFRNMGKNFYPQLFFWLTTRYDDISTIGDIDFILTRDPRRYLSPIPEKEHPIPPKGLWNVFKDGRLVQQTYLVGTYKRREQTLNDDGSITDFRFSSDGRKHGVCREFDPNGYIKEEIDTVRSENPLMARGIYRSYYPGTRVVRFQAKFTDKGKAHGLAFHNYPSGARKDETIWFENQPVQGSSVVFDEQGNVIDRPDTEGWTK